MNHKLVSNSTNTTLAYRKNVLNRTLMIFSHNTPSSSHCTWVQCHHAGCAVSPANNTSWYPCCCTYYQYHWWEMIFLPQRSAQSRDVLRMLLFTSCVDAKQTGRTRIINSEISLTPEPRKSSAMHRNSDKQWSKPEKFHEIFPAVGPNSSVRRKPLF